VYALVIISCPLRPPRSAPVLASRLSLALLLLLALLNAAAAFADRPAGAVDRVAAGAVAARCCSTLLICLLTLLIYPSGAVAPLAVDCSLLCLLALLFSLLLALLIYPAGAAARPAADAPARPARVVAATCWRC
jgi:hypothetical protein